jgi:protein-S-isoprenylcysteine O-methyltransferase Ste14
MLYGLAEFGDEYAAYREGVPMWLPRLKPWKG